MKTNEEIILKIEDLKNEQKQIPRTADEENVYKHKAIYNQIWALRWVLGEVI